MQRSADVDDQIDAGFKIGKLVNKILGVVMKGERRLMAHGLTFPFGGSLLLVAKKEG